MNDEALDWHATEAAAVGSMYGEMSDSVFVFDGRGTLLFRFTPGVNISLGAVNEFICKSLDKKPERHALHDHHGVELSRSSWIHSLERPAFLTLLPCPVRPAMRESLAILGVGRLSGMSYRWGIPQTRSEDAIEKRRRVTHDTVRYDRLPTDVLNLVLAYVDNPVTLMDMRLVCRDFRQFIDDNLERLVQRFRKDIEKTCGGRKLIFNNYLPWRFPSDAQCPTAANLLRVVSMMTCRLPPPLSTRARANLLRLLLRTPMAEEQSARDNPFKKGSSKDVNCVHLDSVGKALQLTFAAARGKTLKTGPNEIAELPLACRILRAVRELIPDIERLGRRVQNKHWIVCANQKFPPGYMLLGSRERGFFEAWVDNRDDTVHFAEINLVRIHAMLTAMGPWLWENRNSCDRCNNASGHTNIRV